MKRIYLARDISQAQLLVNLLEQQLIPACIENAHQSGGLGELAVSYPEVWIKREQDASKARRIIEQFESSAVDSEVICPRCSESNPAGFEWCWSCQADLG